MRRQNESRREAERKEDGRRGGEKERREDGQDERLVEGGKMEMMLQVEGLEGLGWSQEAVKWGGW